MNSASGRTALGRPRATGIAVRFQVADSRGRPNHALEPTARLEKGMTALRLTANRQADERQPDGIGA